MISAGTGGTGLRALRVAARAEAAAHHRLSGRGGYQSTFYPRYAPPVSLHTPPPAFACPSLCASRGLQSSLQISRPLARSAPGNQPGQHRVDVVHAFGGGLSLHLRVAISLSVCLRLLCRPSRGRRCGAAKIGSVEVLDVFIVCVRRVEARGEAQLEARGEARCEVRGGERRMGVRGKGLRG